MRTLEQKKAADQVRQARWVATPAVTHPHPKGWRGSRRAVSPDARRLRRHRIRTAKASRRRNR